MKWQIWKKYSDTLTILYCNYDGGYICAPLYCHSFQLLRPHFLTEAEKFNIKYPNPETIPNIADKLRYYRYKKDLLQREVAEFAGINESTYISYENPSRDYYPKDKLCKIAELLEVDVYDLLDDYNRFLFDGQGEQIRKIRKSMGMTQYQFAKLHGVSAGAVKRWESGKDRVFKETWQSLISSVE